MALNRKLALGCVLVLSWVPAHAYIDPGTGSALIQGLIAAIAALGVTVKLYWHRLTRIFAGKKQDKETKSVSAASRDTAANED
jgi:uncharacterized membrane protein